MAIVNRFTRIINPPGPRRADDVIADATRTVWDADDMLADAIKLLDRPTQATNDAQDYILRELRRHIRAARLDLGKVPR